MSGYAPNPSSSSETGYASLTAGLLARKGEAMPAVDADAHAGVDIDMRPVTPAGEGKDLGQETIQSLYPPNPKSPDDHPAPQLQARPAAPDTAPDIWTITPPRSPRAMRRRPFLRPPDHGDHQRKATVTFRMPAKDFIRMRFASRDMEMSCQSIILEALDCYLDANDVEPVTDEACEAEVERLTRDGAKKRSMRKAASLTD